MIIFALEYYQRGYFKEEEEEKKKPNVFVPAATKMLLCYCHLSPSSPPDLQPVVQ